MTSQNVFYWNSADTRDHKHQRIEWSIANGYLVSINIKITDKLFNKVKTGDIILAYEPKGHKVSISKYDGYCIDCSHTRTDGHQAFTYAFEINDKPIKLTHFEQEKKLNLDIIYNSWTKQYNSMKDSNCEDIKHEYAKYCNDYYTISKKYKYIFPIKLIKQFSKPITTKSNSTTFYYNKSIIKGFDEIFSCGCIFNNKCSNIQCIYYHIHNELT